MSAPTRIEASPARIEVSWRMGADLLLLVLATLSGCNGTVECTTELADGRTTYTGRSQGKTEDKPLQVESVRDACRQRCAIEKTPVIDACASRCAADVEAGKIGAKTSCSKH